MLPSKGNFHDIECPFYDDLCERPYCHFRHRKKPTDIVLQDKKHPAGGSVPTYKPTPKSQLANIQNINKHIPISYVPDLAFRPRRQLPKFEASATYKPTPLSILSSATQRGGSEENGDGKNREVIQEIKQNIANVAYNPVVSLQEVEVDLNETEKDSRVLPEVVQKNQEAAAAVEVKPGRSGDRGKKDRVSTSSSSSSSRTHKKSSREKHRKEERKDSKPEKKDGKNGKEERKDSKGERHSHRKSDRKDREKQKEKDRDRKRHKDKKTSRRDEKKKPKPVITKSPTPEPIDFPSDVDVDINCSDDEDDNQETLKECYKIFNEYIPTPSLPPVPIPEPKPPSPEASTGKKRVAHSNPTTACVKEKPKSITTPGQILTNRFKLAKLAQANKEQDNLIQEMKHIANKRPAPSLLVAARQHKIQKTLEKPPDKPLLPPISLVDDIINGAMKRKIAPVQNVHGMQQAKARIEEMARRKAAMAAMQPSSRTVAQSQKGGRVAHVPDMSLSDIPDVLQAEKSKLPVNVRTRLLTSIADECVKLYLTKTDAYTRALNEEFACYEKCKVLSTYRNSALLAVNRLRKEVLEREKKGLGPLDPGEGSSHSSASNTHGQFYNKVKRWILTTDELDLHGYPRESTTPGRAIIINNPRKVQSADNLNANSRKCSRCATVYSVDDDGWPLSEEECLYHPLKKRTIRGEQTYLCCRTSSETGCVTSDTHVSECSTGDLDGFQTTLPPERDDDPRSIAVYALDCEMCYTTKGLELTRVTIVDTDCKTVYESLVKPLNPIIDYNTRFSGITEEQMNKTSTSILQIQANILHLCNSQTILVGHSLESDMKALKIVHGTVIDTSILFPHKMGLPHKRALKVLASEFLKKIIQNDVNGHDSAEDAVTCMELLKWKLKDELKVRK